MQPRDDVQGARRLGGQSSPAEGGGREHHQRQVRSLLANTPVRSAGSDRDAPPPLSVNGDVRFFEPRTPDSVNVLQTVKGLTALDIHPQANLFAW